MRLPFAREDFLDVFAAYNAALWPFALGLWLLTAGLVGAALHSRRSADRALSALLAFHWLWSGAAYHAAYFSRVNPAAWLFAAGFLLEAALLAWTGVVRGALRFSSGRSPRHLAAGALVVYALAYPAVNVALGYTWPRVPSFGVPCPTTILTAGLLLAAAGSLGTVAVLPLLWCVVGGSAAALLGVRADLALSVAGVALLAHVARSRHEARATPPPPGDRAG